MALTRRQLLSGLAGAVPLGCRTSAVPTPPAGNEGPREVTRVVRSQKTTEGAGVRLNRSLGGPALASLDPFLLLDEFHTDRPDDYAAGFPSHPHRGFETVTYMIEGAMEHKDSVGNKGRLGPGAAQWMTAGHGIVHSEMPKQERGLMWGFQLWVNLPRARKMIRPRYQDIAPAAIPEVIEDRVRTRVVAGAFKEQTGPVSGIDVDPLFLDVALVRGGTFEHRVPSAHAAFVYVTSGAVRFGNGKKEVREGELAILSGTGAIAAACDAEQGRFLLLSARPLGEPIARYGPFVMSTDEEIKEAIADYRSGRLTEG